MTKRWPLVRLGEALTQFQEYVNLPEPREYRKLSVKLYGKGVVLDAPANGATLKMQKHQLAKAGQVILSEIWGKKGAIGFVPEEGEGALCTSHFFLFDVRTDRIEPGYLALIFRRNYLEPQLNAEARGTTGYAAVRPKHLLACEIPLPPLEEQRRIVARIDGLAAQIEEARALRREVAQEIDALKQRASNQLLARHKASPRALRELLSEPLINGLSIPATRLGTGVCFAKVGVVNTGKFNPLETKLVDIDLPPESPYWLRDGDIVVSRGNSPELVGRAAIYRGEPPQCAMPDLLIRIRLDPTKADTRFVAAFFNSSDGRDYISSQISGTSSTMPKISQPKLEAMRIPLPTLTEQRRIVTELDVFHGEVDTLERLHAQTAAELNALLPSILDRAFRGQL